MATSRPSMVPPSNPATATPTHKTKDGLIRLLLQNAQPTPPSAGGPGSRVGIEGAGDGSTSTKGKPTAGAVPHPATGASSGAGASSVPTVTITDENQARFIHQLSKAERESGSVGLDHSYPRPINWRPDQAIQSPPTRTLFVNKVIRNATAQAALDNR